MTKFPTLSVDLSSSPNCFCFHPSYNIVATGFLDGAVEITSLSECDNKINCQLQKKLIHHKKSCRSVDFAKSNGNCIITASKGRMICLVDIITTEIIRKLVKATSHPINVAKSLNRSLLAVGDDSGCVKIFDERSSDAVMKFKECDDYISDLLPDDNSRFLLASSGEGTLTCFDLRKQKLKLQSELFDSDLTSLCILKNSTKVLCGSAEGVTNIFNWGEWGNISDRFPGNTDSVDCMQPITDDIVITGCADGSIRALNILPNRFLGEIGSHDNLPVIGIGLSPSGCEQLGNTERGKWLISVGQDDKMKFWNVEKIANEKISTSRNKAKKGDKFRRLRTMSADKDSISGLSPRSRKVRKLEKDTCIIEENFFNDL